MNLIEADPNLELYHNNFRRPTKTLREIYRLTTNEKLKAVLDYIFQARKVSPVEIVKQTDTPTQEAIEAYQEKQNRKLERYQNLAQKNESKSNDLWEYNKKLADVIPFGQPILIGHHSEGRHRRHLERIQNTARKAIETKEKSDYYKDKADNILNSNAISSDDPEAIIKLVEKLNQMEKERAEIKARPHKDWELSNLGANIRRVKQRIEELRALKNIADIDTTINGVRVFTDKADNRLKISFPCKPNPEIISKLKHSGFHWSPFNKTWQRMIGNHAIYLAEQIQKEFTQ